MQNLVLRDYRENRYLKNSVDKNSTVLDISWWMFTNKKFMFFIISVKCNLNMYLIFTSVKFILNIKLSLCKNVKRYTKYNKHMSNLS